VELAAEATERVTAATDAVLALAGVIVGLTVRGRGSPSFRRTVWLAAMGCLAASSALAAAAHGLALAEAVRQLLWQPLWLLLGLMIALFVVGALHDWRGQQAARRALGPMVGVALAFYLVTRLAGGNFLAFVVYEAIGLLFAATVYAGLARARRPGARGIALALGLSLVAGAVQATSWRADVAGLPFDHNGLFHLVQLTALPFLAIGLRRLLSSVSSTPSAVDPA
jgi:hypothetical protein